MKTSSSRFSHAPEKRFSNLGQIQGGMVTDADLSEAGQIHQARDDAQSAAIVGSGAPAKGGIFRNKGAAGDPAAPLLTEGTLFAQGRQGHLRAARALTGSKALELYFAQADLPLGPQKLPPDTAVIYADLWERPVRAVQDGELADAGLHGAETAFRTRTMTQLKAFATGDRSIEDATALARERLAAGAWPFCPAGTGRISVAPKALAETEITDPCAPEITAERTVPNALFRLEVIAASTTGEGIAREITLAWSFENAAALEEAGILEDPTARAAFARDGAVYEFLSDATEAQIGAFPDGHRAERPVLSETLHPAPPPEAGRNGGAAFSHVRRWDGAVTLNLSDGAVSGRLGPAALPGTVALASGVLTLDVEAFVLTLPLSDAIVLVGDSWHVELRRFAPEAGRVKAVAEGRVTGPHHHFCELVTLDDGQIAAPDAESRRRMTFPSLPDLAATDVAYAPRCPDLYGPAETVGAALDALCDLDAGQVAFTPPADCARFAGTATVEDALARLCAPDKGAGDLDAYLRHAADWGVVCGLKVKVLPGGTDLAWTSGTMIDRSGRFSQIPAGGIAITALKEDAEAAAPIRELDLKTQLVLAFGREADGTVRPYLTSRARAFGPSDLDHQQAIEGCAALKSQSFRTETFLEELPAKTAEVLETVTATVLHNAAFVGTAALSEDEGEEMERALKEMRLRVLAATPATERAATTAEIDTLIVEAEAKYDPGREVGLAQGVTRMNAYALKLVVYAQALAKALGDESCGCRHAFTPCPPALDGPPHFVPVGRISFVWEADTRLRVARFEPMRNRKQALTLRALRYYQGDFIENRVLAKMKEDCAYEDTGGKAKLPDLKKVPERRPDEIVPGDWREKPPKRYELWEIEPGLVYREPAFAGTYGTAPGAQPGTTQPPLLSADLGAAAAIDTLEAAGLTVSGVIDTAREDTLSAVKAMGGDVTALALGTTPQPGDTVALITTGGAAQNYVLIREGNARGPYETTRSLRAKLEGVAARVEEPAAVAPAPQPAALPDDLEALTATRDALLKDIAAARDGLQALETERKDALVAVEKATEEARSTLKKALEEQAEIRVEMRRNLPIEAALAGNKRALEAMRAVGVVTLADAERLGARDITTALRSGGEPTLTGSALRETVMRLLER